MVTNNNYQLVLVSKWECEKHGISFEEAHLNNIIYKIKYMSKKNFVIDSTNETILEFYNNSSNDISQLKNTYNAEFIVTSKLYTYSKRLFANKNHAFYNFISKCKQYFGNIIKSKKSPHMLFKRQLYGKYIL